MSRSGDLRIPVSVVLVTLVLLFALQVRDLVATIGLRIPALPIPYGGAAMDNLIAVAVAVLAALILSRQRGNLAANLGLRGNGWRGPLLTLVATTPVWIGLALHGRPSNAWSLKQILFLALLFPLAEEIVFRGFGFVFARNDLLWRFPAALLVQAAVFGLIHWHGAGGGTGSGALQILAVTAAGAALLAALDALDGDTIWSGFAFHASLNAAWIVFALSGSAATGWAATWPRLFAAALALVLLWMTRGRG